ncbi:cupin domain-containing protein [Spirosoma aerolatum]|uniref:cupin domain-containing protein n=1 Tax=Spirosoma aerolatum TaxID=1211326 RepID=UPI0009AE9C72|nr:cupin domain-containing protein [Spirosoma aerolatum]
MSTTDAVIKKEEEIQSFLVDPYTKIFNYFSSDHSTKVSVVVLELTGEHSRRVNHVSDKIYYILEGKLDIEVEGIKYTIKKGDSILIKSEKWHEMFSEACKMLVICGPSFNDKDENIA